MKKLFVDTSAWYAISDLGDTNHKAALAYRNEIVKKNRLVVTNYIWDELYTLLLMSLGYRKTVDFKSQLDILVTTNIIEVVWVREDTAREAWAIFEKYNVDKHWSFTDCVSYVVMKQLGITEAFTFDRHFAQMSFVPRP
ncbi:MAG: type II toxin-antitoxin system VapC family toxin [Hormoscilla sp. GM102CHS1]|nr:type II toxin-antitoxin system VapC family toxin [Hormoscilla sp. GM102CHS1]